ncbi:hypothetical protein [Streptomyces sp. NPDC058255]|uniref:hypothetical protein n=1 Tax=Streptomyces sp. NPDC058255 TaxID=3346407 RepID=UPI0036F16845
MVELPGPFGALARRGPARGGAALAAARRALAWLDLVLLGVFSVNAGLVLCHRVVRPGPGDLWGRLLHTVSQAVLAAGMIKFVHFGDWMSRPHPAGSPPVDDTQAYTALGVCLVAGLIGLAGYGLCGIMPLIRAEAGITETNHE